MASHTSKPVMSAATESRWLSIIIVAILLTLGLIMSGYRRDLSVCKAMTMTHFTNSAIVESRQPAHTDTDERYIYIRLFEGISNRLRTISAAVQLEERWKIPIKFIWLESDSHTMAGALEDYFSEPKLNMVNEVPVTCCKNQSACGAGDLPEFWEVKHLSQRVVTWLNDGKATDLCVKSLKEFAIDEKWYSKTAFYSQLRLQTSLQKEFDSFKAQHKWDEWGQWIGLHIRRTDLRLFDIPQTEGQRIRARENITISLYVDMVKPLAELLEAPRYFIATDDKSAEDEFVKLMEAQKVKNYNSIAIYPKPARDTPNSHFRGNVQGVKEGMFDLFLLAETSVVLGTHSSSYSLTAERLGKQPLVLRLGPGFDTWTEETKAAALQKFTKSTVPG